MLPSSLLLAVACSTTPAARPPAPTAAPTAAPTSPLAFDSVPLARTAADKTQLRIAPSYRWNGETRPLAWQSLLRGGDVIGGVPFGVLLDAKGQPMKGDDDKPLACDSADFSALLQTPHGLFLAQHIECVPAGLYLSRLEQKPDGALVPVSTKAVDESSVGGSINHCAGDLTPWGTWLSSEEYDIDARVVRPDGTLPKDDWGWHLLARYLGVPLAQVDPYDYGWIPEITVTSPEGGATIVKHYAIGRFSHELGLVLPDRRTVMLTDDGKNVGLFMFVADKPDDLSAGQLYAAKFTQTDAAHFKLTWVPLGHATDAEVKAKLDGGRTAFTDLFDVAEPVAGSCPDAFASVHTSTGHECLRVRAGQDVLASRMESRRYAAIKGATTELVKGEGLAWDDSRKRVYYAVSSVSGSMLQAHADDVGGPDHIGVPRNDCGTVVALDTAANPADTVGARIDSPFVPATASFLVEGMERPYDGDLSRNKCDVDKIANPDNLAYIPTADAIIIAEDTHRHENQALWAYELKSNKLVRLISAPYGGELTGLHWHPDVGGHAYLTVTIQHPFDPDYLPEGFIPPDGEQRTITGVLGPFPVK